MSPLLRVPYPACMRVHIFMFAWSHSMICVPGATMYVILSHHANKPRRLINWSVISLLALSLLSPLLSAVSLSAVCLLLLHCWLSAVSASAGRLLSLLSCFLTRGCVMMCCILYGRCRYHTRRSDYLLNQYSPFGACPLRYLYLLYLSSYLAGWL